MQDFRNISIKNKLRLIILLTSGIVVILASTAFVINEVLFFHRSMVADLFTLADIMGINSSGGLLFNDSKAAEENMAALKAKPHVISAHIFSDQGEHFASYFRESASQTQIPQHVKDLYPLQASVQDNYFFKDSHIEVFKAIIFEQEKLGIVYVQSDLAELSERLSTVGSIEVTVMLASLLIAFLLASKLQQVITIPIYNLLETMKTVSTHKTYSIRAEKPGNDELGSLIDGFNKMLSQIELRDKELGQYRDHLEEKVAQRTSELSEARDQALAANKAKSIFLANMSHEIRTPMNAVLGYAQILRRDSGLTQEQRSALQIIEDSGNHLLGLINDILDISKIEAGAMELRLENFYLDDLIHSLSAMFKMRCEQKHLAWHVEEALETHKAVYTDQGKLRQILINLLGNAVKFTEKGKVSLHIATTTTPSQYCFKIIDSGPGIPLETQQTIFEPFQQEKAGFDKGGTGLGLAITKRQLELMQGTISLKSQPGEGACFTVLLPLPAGEGKVTRQTRYTQVSQLAAHCQVNALVVDDIKENRDILSHMLQDIGSQVREAINGQEALDKILEQVPDVVFMDIRMPVMDGMETIRRIRKLPFDSQYHSEAINNIICVAISASTLQHQSRAMLEAGFDDFISKPFRFEEVYESLVNYLQVEFEYETSINTLDETPIPEDLTQFSLPTTLYNRLQEAAELNELTEMEEILIEMRIGDDKQQKLANILQEFLANYDIDGILETLNQITIQP